MRARSGFTILEVVAALAVLAIAMAGAAFLLASAYGTFRHQDRTIEVTRVVHDQMETLSATDYQALASEIKQARHPDDPIAGSVPGDRDYVSRSSGDASARYELEPPADPRQDWQPLPKSTVPGLVPQTSGQAPTNRLKALMRLQFWDPEFDAPSLRDKGLIRASFHVADTGGIEQEATKYVARGALAGDPAPAAPAAPVAPAATPTAPSGTPPGAPSGWIPAGTFFPPPAAPAVLVPQGGRP